MSTINITNITSYTSSTTLTSKGAATGTSELSMGKAQNDAGKNAIADADSKVQYPVLRTASSSTSYTGNRVGQILGSITSASDYEIKASGTMQAYEDATLIYWADAQTISQSSRQSTGYQIALNFSANVTSSTIKSATLKFTAAGNGSGTINYQVSPLKTSSSTYGKYYVYNDSNAPIDWGTKASFEAGGTSSKNYSVTITDVFKKSIDRKNNNTCTLVIYIPGTTPYNSRYLTISNVSIEYDYNITKCTAPTSISFTNIVKPGGNLTITWSGAGSGTNNSITGYDVYYKIDGAPTINSYDGKASVSSTSTSASKSFTISSSEANRGKIFYAMVRTKGSAGSSYYSDWKNNSGGKVNSLSGAPNATWPSTSINEPVSTDTSNNVSITGISAGSTETGQTGSVYYSIGNGSKTKITSSTLNLRLTENTTVNLYTWDGLEYGSANSKTFTVTKYMPTITSFNMVSNHTSPLTPFGSNSTSNNFVYQINCSTTITQGNRGVNCIWYLLYNTGTDATVNANSSSVQIKKEENITGNTISLTNFDITSKLTFNRSYKIKVVITDVGDSSKTATRISNNQFFITNLPTVTFYNNKKSAANINPSGYFGDGFKVTLDSYTSSASIKVYYNTNTLLKTISSTNTNITINDTYERNKEHTFQVIIKLSSASKTYTKTYTRAPDIDLKSISLVASGETKSEKVYPYTDTRLNFSIARNSIVTNCFDSTLSSVFSFKFYNYNKTDTEVLSIPSNSITFDSSSEISRSPINGQIDLTKFTTENWAALYKTGSNSPYSSHTTYIKVIATNVFGEEFEKMSSNYIFYFDNGFVEDPVVNFCIFQENSTNGYKNLSGYDSSSRYPLKESQWVGFKISNIKCYTNQKITVQIIDSQGILNITNNLSVIPTTTSDKVNNKTVYSTNYYNTTTTNGSLKLEFQIPKISSFNSNTLNKAKFTVNITSNNEKKTSTFENCYYCRNNPDNIKLTLTPKERNNNLFTLKFSPSDLGYDPNYSYNNGVIYQQTYCKILASSNSNSGYEQVKIYSMGNNQNSIQISGSNYYFDLRKDTREQTVTVELGESLANEDIIYFGIAVYIKNIYLPITKNGNNNPIYNSTWNYTYFNHTSSNGPSLRNVYNLTKYFNEIPNLLYGKNFFVINKTNPLGGTSELLTICPYKNRNKIYFKDENTYFEINDDNGLIIDGGAW